MSSAPVSGQFYLIQQIYFSCSEDPVILQTTLQRFAGSWSSQDCFGKIQMARKTGCAESILVYLSSHSVQGQQSRSTSEHRGQSKHAENLLTSNTFLKRVGGNVAFRQIFPWLFIYEKQWNVYSRSTLTPAHGATGLFCSCLFKEGQLIIFN